MIGSGADLAVVSKVLRHSALAITADTYTHLLDGVGRAAAEGAVSLVPRAKRVQGEEPTGLGDQSVTISPDQEAIAGAHSTSNMPLTSDDFGRPRGLEPTTRGLKVRCSAN